MASAPLSAAAAAARSTPAAAAPRATPSNAARSTPATTTKGTTSSSRAATTRSRDAAAAWSERRRRGGGGGNGGARPDPRTEQQRRQPRPRRRSRSNSRRGGSAGGSSAVIRGILHKRRDHLTYGSSAWRPRLFLLDRERQSLTYYLLLKSGAGGDRNASAAAAATPGGRGREQQQQQTTTPRRSPSTPSLVTAAAATSAATTPSSPSQMDATDIGYEVTPRGVIPLRGCVVRPFDVGFGGGRTPGRTPRRTAGTPGPTRGGEGAGNNNNGQQLFGMVISPSSSSSSQLKHDVYLATTTADDRTVWLQHLAAGCGMAVSPVPGGLPVVPSAPPSSSSSRRIPGASSSRVEVGSGAVEGDGGEVEGEAEERREGRGGEGGTGDDTDNENEDEDMEDDAEGEATSAAAYEADSKEEDAETKEEDEAATSVPVSTPAHPSATASPPTPPTTSSSNTPFRATSRRIFETPGAVRAESEAGSSYTTSRSTTGPSSRTGVATGAGTSHPHVSTLTPPHSLLSLSPLVQTAAVLLAPPIILRTIRCIIPLSLLGGALPQLLLFLLLARWSVRTIVVGQYLGRPLRTGRGASALHGPVTCRIAVDLRGVLRFIGTKREEHTPAPAAAGRIGANGGGRGRGSSSTSHVSVTHIVGKAIATALSEATAELNCRHISIPMLGVEGWYERESVAVSIVSSSTQRVSTIVDADTMTVQEIADEVWRRQREGEPVPPKGLDMESLSGMISHAWSLCKSVVAKVAAGHFAAAYSYSTPSSSCMIFTSPDSENNEVDIEIAPLPAKGRQPMLHAFREGPCPITVMVGGVRVIERDPRNTSSHQSRRPMLSIAITFDCPGCSVAACRKLSERVQTLVQFPEMCD